MSINNTNGIGTYRDKRFRESENTDNNAFIGMLPQENYAQLNAYLNKTKAGSGEAEDKRGELRLERDQPRAYRDQPRLHLIQHRANRDQPRLHLIQHRVSRDQHRVHLIQPNVDFIQPRVDVVKAHIDLFQIHFNDNKDMFYSTYSIVERVYVNLN